MIVMKMPRALAIVISTLLIAAPAIAQERYVRAEEDQHHNLVITTASGRSIVLQKGIDKEQDSRQVGFGGIAISPDRQAVGWQSYYENCCTSYPIPSLVEVYTSGKRITLDPAIVAWSWCFVDDGSRIATVSSTVHGPQHQIIELWDVAHGAWLESFTWMDGENYPRAPAWVIAVRRDDTRTRARQTHLCSTTNPR